MWPLPCPVGGALKPPAHRVLQACHKVLSNNCWLGMPTGTSTYVSQLAQTCLYYWLKVTGRSVLKDLVLWGSKVTQKTKNNKNGAIMQPLEQQMTSGIYYLQIVKAFLQMHKTTFQESPTVILLFWLNDWMRNYKEIYTYTKIKCC